MPRAQLLRRVWLTRILVRAGCGGRRELVGQVTDPFAARKTWDLTIQDDASLTDPSGLDPMTRVSNGLIIPDDPVLPQAESATFLSGMSIGWTDIWNNGP